MWASMHRCASKRTRLWSVHEYIHRVCFHSQWEGAGERESWKKRKKQIGVFLSDFYLIVQMKLTQANERNKGKRAKWRNSHIFCTDHVCFMILIICSNEMWAGMHRRITRCFSCVIRGRARRGSWSVRESVKKRCLHSEIILALKAINFVVFLLKNISF